ncbi:MAG: peptidylprolyl isomerase [candidate division Zixibacteria bacterium]|nr:peptidylprolyl isomerase [candidate division Zixibacteria bacterium]
MKTHRLKSLISAGRVILLLIWIFHLLLSLSSAQEVLDRIVAVVGNQIILESELEMQLNLYANQMGVELKTEKQKSQLENQLLEQMINDKLLLIAAQKDTIIEVTSKEVEEAVRNQLKKIKSEFSEEAFEAQLKAEGLTESELKKKYREQIKNQMMIDRLVSSKLSKVSVSTREVKDFYQTYKDSIPDQPEAVKLSHILLEIKPSQETLDSLKRKAEMVLKLTEKDKDFSHLASLYSDDPSAKEGGDLGFFKKGDMIPKFEEVAFALKPGEISKVVETEFGYHIIKVEEKRDDLVHARHILILVRPSGEDSLRAKELADSLYHQLLKGTDFGELAKKFSTDEESKKLGGELGWYPVDQMTPEFKEGVKGLEIGEVSPPLESQFGVHILKVLDKREQRKLSLEDDWDTIKDMVRRKKTNELIAKWVEKMRQDTYVEIRL